MTMNMVTFGMDLLGKQVLGNLVLLAVFIIMGFMLVLSTYKVDDTMLLFILCPLFVLLSIYVGMLTPVGLFFAALALAPLMWKLMGQQF
jgi:hypothetical protein